MVTRAMLNLDEVVNFLPLKEIPYFKFKGFSKGFASRIGEEVLATIKSEEELFWAHNKVKVPCLHCAGWYDLFAGSLLMVMPHILICPSFQPAGDHEEKNQWSSYGCTRLLSAIVS
jgi:hypothetical protein